MVQLVTEGEYVPWYSRRAPPVFCFPCLPIYMGVWPGRQCLLILGTLFFFFGVVILLTMLLMCIALECGGWAALLVPVALILLILGLLLFHCGYAAYLLDDHGQIPIKKTTTTTTTTSTYDPESHEDEIRLFENVHREQLPNVKQGFWQFDEDSSWQAASNPYPIQHTLKNCLDRQPY
ncbi:unnamed protein product [Caenorhabditis angaria]|uniref:Uncharacterized protein n=1 Tax=Caenorhabditis angaria TaxID=860376 RepID=A0A9P1ISD9_9PELO|nr:unnamed protein product [Caenorhabditis angaria]